MRAALPQFSRMGYVAVALVAITGIVNTAILVGRVDGLTGTPYGRLLLAKIALFLLLVVLAGINRLILVPRIAREGATARRDRRADLDDRPRTGARPRDFGDCQHPRDMASRHACPPVAPLCLTRRGRRRQFTPPPARSPRNRRP